MTWRRCSRCSHLSRSLSEACRACSRARSLSFPGPAVVLGLLRRGLNIASVTGLVLVGGGILLVDPIRDALNIGSSAIVIAGVSAIFFAVVAAVLYGVLQGSLRFSALAVTYSISGLARPVLVVPALLLGLGAAGALAVNTIAGGLAVAIAAFALRDLWHKKEQAPAPSLDRRQMGVMLLGSLAFASLTNVDILLAALPPG